MNLIKNFCVFFISLQMGAFLYYLVDADFENKPWSFFGVSSKFTHSFPDVEDWLPDHLDSLGIEYSSTNLGWFTSVETRDYRNILDQNEIMLFLIPDNQQNMVSVFAAYLFWFDPENAQDLIEHLPSVQYLLDILQIDYDPRDGEVRGRLHLLNYQPQQELNFERIFNNISKDADLAYRILSGINASLHAGASSLGLGIDRNNESSQKFY